MQSMPPRYDGMTFSTGRTHVGTALPAIGVRRDQSIGANLPGTCKSFAIFWRQMAKRRKRTRYTQAQLRGCL